MRTLGRALALLVFATAVSSGSSAFAQCASVDPGFADPSLNNNAFATAIFDDGSGASMYVGGAFTLAGGATRNRIARWTTHYSALGTGMNGDVLALCVFDDGTGPALYAGGAFTTAGSLPAAHVARWNGTSWSALSSGTNATVRALTVFDDGSGPALYAGGDFTTAGGNAASRVARWDGTAWTPLGNGASGLVDALSVFDDGAGPALYAGGQFLSAGAVPARNVARWKDGSWSILGNGTNGRVRALAVHSGALCAGGDFTTAGGLPASRVARWNGSAWSSLGTGTDQSVHALLSIDSASGPALVAGGTFAHAGSVNALAVARWDGSTWAGIGEGLAYAVEALTVEPAGRLVAAGSCTIIPDGGVLGVVRFDGTRWTALAQGVTENYVSRLAVADDGQGKAVYMSGLFDQAGGIQSGHLARWSDGAWTNPGPPGQWLFSMTTFDLGLGPRLIGGGGFSDIGGVLAHSVASFDGTSWSPIGNGLNGNVYSLGVFDDGNGRQIYAGGTFTASGTTQTRYIARWNGSAWSEVLGGLTPPLSQSYANVRGMAVFDDGHGPALYIVGDFRRAGGVDALRVARFDGTSWSALGSGLDSPSPYLPFANDVAVYDDGTGPALYVGGWFTTAGGTNVNRLAKWNGTSWSAVGAGVNTGVYGLTVFDDGSGHGSALYVATGGEGILRWDGTTLSTFALQSLVPNDQVQSVCAMPARPGAPAELWAGGHYTSMNGAPASAITRFIACDSIGAVFCSGDGTGTACPCGNAGASGNGCATSFNALGGHLGARGNPSVSEDTVVLEASGISNSVVTFFQGTQRVNGGAGAVFGDGLRCAGGTTVRLTAVQSIGGAAHYPGPSDEAVSVRGVLPGTGGKRSYQVWYRNAAAFCTPATFTLTNGLELTWMP